MASLLRKLVAGPRIHHAETGLDLCYVTDRIIATSGPSPNYPQRAYRNPLDALVNYLDNKHDSAWAIWEFRAEGTGYSDDAVYGRIQHFPWPDHHPPPFEMIPRILDSMRRWLNDDEERVVVVHCKAGKGRSGTIACSYLIAEEGWKMEDALTRFTERRMRARFGAGVSIPSQLRYVGYMDRWARQGKKMYVDGSVEILEVRIWGLRDGVQVSVEGYMDCGRRIKTFYVFDADEDVDVVMINKDVVVAARDNDDDSTKKEEKEEQQQEEEEVVMVFKPSKGKKIILPTNDINICFERRRQAAVLNKMMLTSVAHVWFNAFFEATTTREQSNSEDLPPSTAEGEVEEEKNSNSETGTPPPTHTFSIPWEALDGIKGGSFKGSKALERLEVLFRRCT